MPYDPSQLPELSGDRPPVLDRNVLAQLYRMRKGEVGPVDYRIDHKGIRLDAPIGNAIADLMYRYNGDWKANVGMPLFGGELDVNIGERNGDKRYGLKFKKRF